MQSDRGERDSRAVVRRVYRELRNKGVSEIWAYETAAKVFNLRHPDVSERDSRFEISAWLA